MIAKIWEHLIVDDIFAGLTQEMMNHSDMNWYFNILILTLNQPKWLEVWRTSVILLLGGQVKWMT